MQESGSRRSEPLVCEFIYELPRAVSALFRLWLLLLLSGFFCSDWYTPLGTFLELAALLPILIYNSSQVESCPQCLGQYIQPWWTDYWSFPSLTSRSVPFFLIFPSLSLQLSLSETFERSYCGLSTQWDSIHQQHGMNHWHLQEQGCTSRAFC